MALCSFLQALFTTLRDQFPHLRFMDLGGGLGVPYRPTDTPLDLQVGAVITLVPSLALLVMQVCVWGCMCLHIGSGSRVECVQSIACRAAQGHSAMDGAGPIHRCRCSGFAGI